MKKVISMFLAFVLVISFSACSNNEPGLKDDLPTISLITNDNYKTSYEMSNNLYDYQVIIDDVVYQFPMTVEEVLKCGWGFETINGEKEMLEAGCYSSYNMNSKYDTNIIFYITNFSKSNQLVKDCYAVGVSIYKPSEYDNISVEFCNEIHFESSTELDVISAYGNPTETRESEEYKYLTYGEDTSNNVEFTIKNNVVIDVSMINIKIPSDFVDAGPSNESVNIDYKQPTSLGNDIKSGIFELDGVLYQMPVPVSELEKNGWIIDTEKTEETIAAGDYVYAVLRKGNFVLDDIEISNTTDSEIYSKNGLVTDIESFDVKGTEIKLPCNIIVGMNKADVFSVIGNQSYEKAEYSSDKYFFVIDEENYISVTIAFEEDKVDYFSLDF